MKNKKTIGRVLILSGFVVLLLLAVVFLLASSVPDNYRPFILNQEDRRMAAEDFVNSHGLKFLEKVRVQEPFTHSIAERDMNVYLASLDEIAFLKPAKRGKQQKTGGVYEAMDKGGLADPVVAMDDGILTIMVRTKNINKVISMDISFEIDDNQQLTVGLEQIRIGRMPIPQGVVASSIKALKRDVADHSQLDEASVQDLDALIAAIISAAGDEPIPARIKFDRKRIRDISDITVDDGELKIRVVPAPGSRK